MKICASCSSNRVNLWKILIVSDLFPVKCDACGSLLSTSKMVSNIITIVGILILGISIVSSLQIRSWLPYLSLPLYYLLSRAYIIYFAKFSVIDKSKNINSWLYFSIFAICLFLYIRQFSE